MNNGDGAIAAVGSLNQDLGCVLARLPDKGETPTALPYGVAVGGKGANQAVAAARPGVEGRGGRALCRQDHGQGDQ